MAASFNASRLFNSSVEKETAFIDHITLSDINKQQLMSARTELRGALREAAGRAVEGLVSGGQSVRPRFVTQGSVSYGTLNSPCTTPPQQADLDDGIYFPLSYVQQNGQPSVAANTLFESVTACLKLVAEEKGWEVDESNPKCVRVIVADDMHVDMPMYSIPDAEFAQLTEAKVRKMATAGDGDVITEEQKDDDWSVVESDRVLLATRDSGWLPKDPRPIKEWVENAVKEKGEQLRRIMRYVKAWRDFQVWEFGDPKSILLMVAAEAAHESSIHGRDDLALKSAARGMAEKLSGELRAPWDESEDLALRLDEHPRLRQDVIDRLNQLADGIEDALDRSKNAADVCTALRERLGSRLPNNSAAVIEATVAGIEVTKSASAGYVGRVRSA